MFSFKSKLLLCVIRYIRRISSRQISNSLDVVVTKAIGLCFKNTTSIWCIVKIARMVKEIQNETIKQIIYLLPPTNVVAFLLMFGLNGRGVHVFTIFMS